MWQPQSAPDQEKKPDVTTGSRETATPFRQGFRRPPAKTEAERQQRYSEQKQRMTATYWNKKKQKQIEKQENITQSRLLQEGFQALRMEPDRFTDENLGLGQQRGQESVTGGEWRRTNRELAYDPTNNPRAPWDARSEQSNLPVLRSNTEGPAQDVAFPARHVEVNTGTTHRAGQAGTQTQPPLRPGMELFAPARPQRAHPFRPARPAIYTWAGHHLVWLVPPPLVTRHSQATQPDGRWSFVDPAILDDD